MQTLSTCLLLALLLSSGPSLANKHIKLTSLDWPPYSGPTLPEKGASVAVVKAAFEASGYQVQVDFFPWERAVALAKDPGKGYAGYFPEYYAQELEADCVFSEPIGISPLGFAQHKQAPVTWVGLDDLSTLKIGVVSGYVNEAEFDKRVAAGKQPVEAVTGDDQNLKKVGAKRLPLAVIDKHVMNYLLNNDPSLASFKANIEFNGKLLEDKKLHVCFRKGPQSAEYAKALADGLKKIDVEAITKKHFQ